MNTPFIGGAFRVTSPYGYRTLNGVRSFHGGIDVVGISSKNVCAVAAGIVVVSQMITDYSNPTWEWGNYIAVVGDDQHVVYYCHMSQRIANVGDRVEVGDIIGVEGNTGYSFGSHLHLEVRTSTNQQVNAADYIGVPNIVGTYNNIIEEDEDMTVERFEELFLQMRKEKLQDNDSSTWSKEAREWAVSTGLIKGSGYAEDGQPNGMWEDLMTREQLVTVLYRFAQMMGRA